MNVFIGRGAAHGRFVHVDVFGDVAQHHRLQMADSMVKKLQLKFEDALGHSKQRLLTLLDALDQPVSGANLFLHFLIGQAKSLQALCLFDHVWGRPGLNLNSCRLGLDVPNCSLQLIRFIYVRFRYGPDFTLQRL